eukprot:gene16366-biopygen3299
MKEALELYQKEYHYPARLRATLVGPSLGAAPEGVPLPGNAGGNTCCPQSWSCTRRSGTSRQGWGQHLLPPVLELHQKEYHFPRLPLAAMHTQEIPRRVAMASRLPPNVQCEARVASQPPLVFF